MNAGTTSARGDTKAVAAPARMPNANSHLSCPIERPPPRLALVADAVGAVGAVGGAAGVATGCGTAGGGSAV